MHFLSYRNNISQKHKINLKLQSCIVQIVFINFIENIVYGFFRCMSNSWPLKIKKNKNNYTCIKTKTDQA